MSIGTDRQGSDLYLAYSYGLLFERSGRGHFAAVYAHSPAGWKLIGDVRLTTTDYIGKGVPEVVSVEPTRTWIVIQGAAGAHSGVFTLLSLGVDGLRSEVSHFTSSPGANELRDIDGDGRLEVVLEETDYYVFCYACGVRLANRALMRWDGNHLVKVESVPLAIGLASSVRNPVESAAKLATAGLYKDAALALDSVPAAKLAEDRTAFWNAALIRLNAEAREAEARNGAYPLLGNVFYGDYPAALDIVRTYRVADVFSQQSPLVVGTVAQAQPDVLADKLTESTDAALLVSPDLAAAYFLRGWAGFLTRPQGAGWRSDIQKAAQLDPRDPLYSDSLRFLSIAPAPIPSVSGPMGLPNPASVNCTRNGGRLLPQIGHGGEFSYCVFPDGSRCEEWAYFRGDCSPGVAWPATATRLAAARIEFAPNSIGAEVKGKLAAGETRIYLLRAMQGQMMSASLATTNGVARLLIRGVNDGVEYPGTNADAISWTGRLPSTQDYAIEVTASTTGADYTLSVTVK